MLSTWQRGAGGFGGTSQDVGRLDDVQAAVFEEVGEYLVELGFDLG